MRDPRLTSVSVSLLAVLLVLQVVAVGAVGAVGHHPSSAETHSPLTPVSDVYEESGTFTALTGPTVETSFRFSQLDEAGVVALQAQYDLPSSVSALRVRIPELATSDTAVVSTNGFERQDETTFEWTRSTSIPELELRLAVSNETVAPEDHGIERDSWAFATVPATEIGFSYSGTRPTFVSSSSVEGTGYATERMAFLGTFDRVDVDVDGETVRFIAGRGETPTNLSGARSYLERAPGRFDFDVRRDRLVVFVLPYRSTLEGDGMLVTGEAYGDAFWVTADATGVTGPENAFAHEYVHSRLTTVGNGSALWLTEATAEYYGYLSTLNTGGSSYDAFKHAVRAERFGPERTAVVLSEPTSWQGSLADYEKGAHVLAALDAEMRARTNGTRTLYDVFVTRQRFEDYEAFRTQVVDTSGDASLGLWLDEYVTTTALPPLPDEPTRFVQGGDLDPDGDGLESAVEASGTPPTNPFVADTDGDGLSDTEEREAGTDPTRVDTDGDTISDAQELRVGTDPLVADTDDDGTNDALDAYPTDPTSRTETPASTEERQVNTATAERPTRATVTAETTAHRTAVSTPGFGVVGWFVAAVLVTVLVRRQQYDSS